MLPAAKIIGKSDPENPLIVQSDGSVLLDLHSSKAEEARKTLCLFARL